MTQQAVTTIEPDTTAIQPAQNPPPDPMLAMIERAAKDPAVDVVKLEKLLEMGERQRKLAAESAFHDAMTAVQAEMRPIATDANNKQTSSKYASYLALDRAMRPIYTRHGFSLEFNTGEGAAENFVRVICDVSRGGFTKRYQIDMPSDGKGAKGGDVMTKTHAIGAGVTYGQRYLLKMIFNIAVGEDNDGNGPVAPISPEQLTTLQAAIVEAGADIEKFCKAYGVEDVKDLPANRYADAIRRLEAKRAQK